MTETIKINPNKPSVLEFEVLVSGVEITPQVKFILRHAKYGMDWSIDCTSLGNNKWEASFPVLDSITTESCLFQVVVILDEYYFIPAEAEIHFLRNPDVSFKAKIQEKPTVTTSFVVKQDEELATPVVTLDSAKTPQNTITNFLKTKYK